MDILKLQDTLLKIKSKAEAINDKNGFKSIQNNLETIIERFYGYNNSKMMQISKMTFYGYTDPDSIKRMVDTNKQLLISLIENMIDEINIFGIPEKESSKESGLNINITQNQTARINLSLIVDSIQNELTGMQLKELQKIIGEKEEDENKHKEKVIEKLKSFGSDVASNILANILTNPQLFGA